MSQLYDQIVSQRGELEKLIARIPGFRGYQEKNARREADRLLRDYIAGALKAQIDRFVAVERDLLEKSGFTHMSKSQAAKTRLQTYRDRVAAAAPGYSGFMDAIRVDEEALARIYSFDEAQARYIDQFADAITAFETAVREEGAVADAIRAIDRLAAEANAAFALRDDVLTDVSKSLTGL